MIIDQEPERFRIGHTKIFFRAGVLGYMEDVSFILFYNYWLTFTIYIVPRYFSYAQFMRYHFVVHMNPQLKRMYSDLS